MSDNPTRHADYVADLRQAIGACLLGETLGDGTGVDVLRVADLLINRLPEFGWSFWRDGAES
jgi:hypothetical protein